jgi:hypothetical protein
MRHAGETESSTTMRIDQRLAGQMRCAHQSMIPKKPAPDVIRDGYRFLEKIMLKQ